MPRCAGRPSATLVQGVHDLPSMVACTLSGHARVSERIRRPAGVPIPSGGTTVGPARGWTRGQSKGAKMDVRSLEGIEWRLTQHVGAEGELVPVVEGVLATATFVDGSVAGSTGCNRYHARCRVDEDRLAVEAIAMTMMACNPERSAVERAFTVRARVGCCLRDRGRQARPGRRERAASSCACGPCRRSSSGGRAGSPP